MDDLKEQRNVTWETLRDYGYVQGTGHQTAMEQLVLQKTLQHKYKTRAAYSRVTVLNQDSVRHRLKPAASHRCFFQWLVRPTHWDVPAQPLPLIPDMALQHPPIPALRFGAAVRSQRCQQDHKDEMWQLSTDRWWKCYCAKWDYSRRNDDCVLTIDCPAMSTSNSIVNDHCTLRKLKAIKPFIGRHSTLYILFLDSWGPVSAEVRYIAV